MLVSRFQATWARGETPSASLLAIRRKLAGDLGLSSMSLPTPTGKPVNRFANNFKAR